MGTSRSSVVDTDTKPRDVYALTLTAGQEVQFRANMQGALRFQLAHPGSQSFRTEAVTLAFNLRPSGSWTREFVPAVTGTYYLAVIAQSSAQPYTVEVLPTGKQFATYTLTITVSGRGSTSPEAGRHTYAEGAKVTIAALPASGWRFESWAGDATGSSTTTTITMDSNRSITAYFVHVPSRDPDPHPESASTPDPEPDTTPAPDPTPQPGDVSVHLHLERTTVVVGEEIRATLSIANSIAKPEMTVRLILKVPPGMTASATEFTEAGAGQYIGIYEVDTGSLRHIGLNLHANEHGEFLVRGHLEWFFGEDHTTLESGTQVFTVTVQRYDPERTKPPIREAAPAWPLIGVAATAIGIVVVVAARRRRV